MTIGKFNFRIAEVSRLHPDVIVALANRDLAAVRVPRWCSEDVCSYFARQIVGKNGTGYDDEPSFLKIIGGAAYDAAGDPEKLKEYLDLTPSWFREQRKVFWPYISPVDRLRVELQELWPHGCELQLFNGRPAFAGLVRAFESGAEARAHQDVTPWDIPSVPEAHEFETQLSAVTYLACAEQGGDLQLWDRSFDERSKYDSCKIPNDYGIDPKYIGEPAMCLTPRLGEMIIFNARTLHAVSRVYLGKRSSQSTFIAFRGIYRPLSVFS